MESMKKRAGALAVFVLALMACLGVFTGTAYADSTVNITYRGIASGDTMQAYRVVGFGGANANEYVYDTNFEAFLKADTSAGGMGYDSTSEFENLAYDSAELRQLVNKYANYIADLGLTPTYMQTSQNNAVMIGFEPGYYLITYTTAAGNTTVYNNSSVFVRYDGESLLAYANGSQLALTDGAGEVDVKSANGATMTKSVHRASGWSKTKTVELGEYVQYGLQITLPNYGDIKFDQDITVTDTMTNLEFVNDTDHPLAAYAGTTQADGTKVDAVTIDGTPTYDTTTHTETVTFKVDPSTITYDAATGVKTLMVSYWAVAKNDMVATGQMKGTNSAVLSYKTTSAGNPVSSATNATTVYTYGVNLTKLGQLSDAPLTGAQFEIFEGSTSQTPLSFVPAYKAGTTEVDYYMLADATTANAVTTLEVNSSGVFEIRGVDATSNKPLYIKETKAPKGYVVPEGRFVVTLASAMNANEHTGHLAASSTFTAENTAEDALAKSLQIDANKQWLANVQLNNSNTHALPTTGGMGTVIFTVAGVALMAAAACAFIVLRRRRN